MGVITTLDEIPDHFKERLLFIEKYSQLHFYKFSQLKFLFMILSSIVTFLNSISITSIALYFAGYRWIIYTSLLSNSLSTILSAIMSVCAFEDKYYSHQTSYLQFREIQSTYQTQYLRYYANSQRLLDLMDELDMKVSIILDNCEPIVLKDVKN